MTCNVLLQSYLTLLHHSYQTEEEMESQMNYITCLRDFQTWTQMRDHKHLFPIMFCHTVMVSFPPHFHTTHQQNDISQEACLALRNYFLYVLYLESGILTKQCYCKRHFWSVPKVGWSVTPTPHYSSRFLGREISRANHSFFSLFLRDNLPLFEELYVSVDFLV